MNKQQSDIEFQLGMPLKPSVEDQTPDPVTVDDRELTYMPDGSVIISYRNHTKRTSGEDNFYENLALTDAFDQNSLRVLAMDLCDAVKEDKESRAQWELKLQKGYKLLGLNSEAVSFPFADACGAYGPTFLRTVLEFSSIASGELLPVAGLVKVQILGETNEELVDRADRVENWFNCYLSNIATEYRADTRMAFFWAVLYGSAFKKTYYDPVKRRPVSPLIAPQDMLLNYGATSLESANRVTQIFRLTKKELMLRQIRGEYRNIELSSQVNNNSELDQSALEKEIEQKEGFTKPSYNPKMNDRFVLHETHANLELKQDHYGQENLPLPYRVVFDKENKEILAIYRNWEKEDNNFNKINFFTQYLYRSGPSPMGWGLCHIAGEMANQETNVMRQIKDAATLSSFPAGFYSTSIKVPENNIRLGPTEYQRIETGGLPIRDCIFPLPFSEPSQTLFQLMEKFQDSIEKIAGTASVPLPESGTDAPVGTTLALLEQNSRPQSTIMRQFNEAMKNECMIMYDIFYHTLGNEPYPYAVPGKKGQVMWQDFAPGLQIIPASDPNLSSATQRIITSEKMYSIAKENPDIFDMREVVSTLLKELKIPNVDKILLPKPEEKKPEPLDPITENQNFLKGETSQAFIAQDHGAHIIVHQGMMSTLSEDQTNADNPKIMANLQAHIQQHVAFQYQLQMQQAMGHDLPENPAEVPNEVQNQIAMAAAQVIQQQHQQQQEQAPPPPIDPTIALIEDTKVKAEGNQMRHMVDMERLKLDAEEMEYKRMYDMKKLEQDAQDKENKRMELEIELRKIEYEAQRSSEELALKRQAQEMELMHKDKAIELKAEGDAYKAQLDFESKKENHSEVIDI